MMKLGSVMRNKALNRQSGFTLVETAAVLIICAVVIIAVGWYVNKSVNIKKSELEAKQLVELSQAMESYLSAHSIFDSTISEVTLKTLRDQGYIDNQFPDEDLYHQHYHILVQPIMNKQRMSTPSALIFTSGDGVYNPSMIASFVGTQGGFVFPNSENIVGVGHSWQTTVAQWALGDIKPTEGSAVVLVSPDNDVKDKNKPQIKKVSVNCSEVGQDVKLSGGCQVAWHPFYEEDYYLLHWSSNSSVKYVEVKITEQGGDKKVLYDVVVKNSDYYRFYAAPLLINEDVIISLTPMGETESNNAGMAITYPLSISLNKQHLPKLKVSAMLQRINYPDRDLDTGSCDSSLHEGQILYMDSFTFTPIKSEQLEYFHTLFPYHLDISATTKSDEGGYDKTMTLYRYDFNDAQEVVKHFEPGDIQSSIDVSQSSCSVGQNFTTFLKINLYVKDNKNNQVDLINDTSKKIQWGASHSGKQVFNYEHQ